MMKIILNLIGLNSNSNSNMNVVDGDVIGIRDLQSLNSYTNYIIEPCHDSKCIYKLFKNIDGYLLTFNKTTGNKQLELVSSANNYNIIKINVLVDDDISVTYKVGSLNNNYYGGSLNSFLSIIDKTQQLYYDIKIRIYGDLKQFSYFIEEVNGKYFVNYFGTQIPIDIFFNIINVNNFDRFIRDKVLNNDVNLINKIISNLTSGNFVNHITRNHKYDGVLKTISKLQQFYSIFDTEKIQEYVYYSLLESSKSSIDNLKMSTIINKIFEHVNTKEEFKKILDDISILFFKHHKSEFLKHVINSIPESRELKKSALKRRQTGAINKIMDDLDFIEIDKDKYPLTHNAVFSGELPLGTFFKKTGDSYFVYNDNWQLWEEMLLQYPDISKEIAAEASKRRQYEKDLMSYFYFTLYKLPQYLERQTGKKWKGIPKLVTSSNELVPPKEGENGVTKSRSALTPIVDNDKNEVIVPYVSMVVHGYVNTYCYALNFNVLETGFNHDGNVVTNEIEKQLNGRDDYGLMFYTLTGSSQGNGYPTFLIIFEKLDSGTKVHFHRTHPMRSKQGDYNPVHAWIKGCYKWMVGNVSYERIIAQQGDLVFVKTVNELNHCDFKEVDSFDSHKFSNPVQFIEYTKKDNQNILGYIRVLHDTLLIHTEHKDRMIPAGDYEIRQCRSWEANPKGIWSLRID